jgi:zinc transporter 1/2/3
LEDYNLSLHVGSVFILLGVSLLGSLAPVAIGVLARSPRVGVAIRLGTYFGGPPGCPQPVPALQRCTGSHLHARKRPPHPPVPAGFGTILSTALIHMLLPGVESLMNECLPPFWIENYEAWPFLFATVAILFMQLVDYLIKAGARGFLGKSGACSGLKVGARAGACYAHAH